MTTVLTQKHLDRAQDALRGLIDMAGNAHAELCGMGLTTERDKMRKVQAMLMLAEAEAGDINIPVADGAITPKSGGK